ncbi:MULTISPECIES: CvpA family protein [unclassified Dysgonomonas]|uniref:CvpA family protein n=1 Tax=unclassified Dysgonomonas TaxID=2630389 RepID=UPI0013ED1A8C|nr:MULTISPECIES: CvpA family protein [unclassified Dysgonomonas]
MNWFDLVIIILVAATLIKGFTSGFVMQAASLAGLILGAIFAGKLSGYIAPKIISLTDGSPHVIGPISYVVAFLLIITSLILLGKAVQSAVKAMEMNALNRIAGAIFCCAKWLIAVSILVNLISEIDQSNLIIKEDVYEKSHTYPLVKRVAPLAIPYLNFDWITQ